MDIQQILVSLGGPAIVTGAIAYALKHSFEKLLDTRIAQLEERNKAFIAENIKRQAQLFDKRSEIYRTIVALAYRSRNAARDALAPPKDSSRRPNDVLLSRLESYHQILAELLYDERAVLPSEFFDFAHEMKSTMAKLHYLLEYRSRRSEPLDSRKEEDLNQTISYIDSLYQQLVLLAQKHLESGIPKSI
jgi:hypothetical protein